MPASNRTKETVSTTNRPGIQGLRLAQVSCSRSPMQSSSSRGRVTIQVEATIAARADVRRHSHQYHSKQMQILNYFFIVLFNFISINQVPEVPEIPAISIIFSWFFLTLAVLIRFQRFQRFQRFLQVLVIFFPFLSLV